MLVLVVLRVGWGGCHLTKAIFLTAFLGCLIVDKRSKPTDIFAIGFEEMVELNAGNIVNAR